MKSLSSLVFVIAVSKVISLRCKCSKDGCNNGLSTCYTNNQYCVKSTIDNETVYGCSANDYVMKMMCLLNPNSTQCCNTDFCNDDSSATVEPSKLTVPTVSLVRQFKRRPAVTLRIHDKDDVRDKIDGYYATLYSPKGTFQKRSKLLKANTRSFTFTYRHIRTALVFQVMTHKDGVLSSPSAPISVKPIIPECLYKRKDSKSKKIKQCQDFGCYSLWKSDGTSFRLQLQGCWNSVSKPKCRKLNNTTLMCTCNSVECKPPSTKKYAILFS